MLVLSRYKNQRIFIGPDVIITLVTCGLQKCRIGIEAPDGVQIMREELLEDAGLEWWRDRGSVESEGDGDEDQGGNHGRGDC